MVDASSGCPEVDFDVALQLISEYEQHVKDMDVHEARVKCFLLSKRWSPKTPNLIIHVGSSPN